MNNSILKNDLLRNYPERDAKNFTVLVVNCSITAIVILISITYSILTWKRFKKSVVNTFIFYLFLLLFHIPSFLIMFLFAIFQNWSEVWNISTTVIFMSSSTNPILLCWRLRELRAAVLKTAKRLLCLRTT